MPLPTTSEILGGEMMVGRVHDLTIVWSVANPRLEVICTPNIKLAVNIKIAMTALNYCIW